MTKTELLHSGARARALNRSVQEVGFEPRWEAAATLVAVLVLLLVLPGRLSLLPVWAPLAAALAVLAPMLVVGLTRGNRRWLRIEQIVTLLFVLSATLANLANLGNLVFVMIYRSGEFGGLTLLTTSIAVWVTNVLTFSLLFWRLDRGGPEARVHRDDVKPDWLFPQEGAPPEKVASGWRPVFVDYLFLGYSTATAFSTTDVMPLTPRAKMLMMVESSIALLTLVVVAARAINILGS